MSYLPILKFAPEYKSIVWGGDKLGNILKKDVGKLKNVGESWELCDLDDYQSKVTGGEFDGKLLGELVAEHKEDLLGTASLLSGKFPLLFKLIDASDTLSVQVHPDDSACEKIGGGARPKTEAWYIIDCDPGAVLYVGLAENVTKESLEKAIKNGTVEDCLYKKSVSPGDYIFLPSGAVHAIGKGIVLAEVQQSSNTTYRVFDWNRVGMDGKPRQLHKEEALVATHYHQVGEPKIIKPRTGRKGVSCEYFEMETVDMTAEQREIFSSTAPVVIMSVKGDSKVTVGADDAEQTLNLGETLIVPACLAERIKLMSSGNQTLVVTTIPH